MASDTPDLVYLGLEPCKGGWVVRKYTGTRGSTRVTRKQIGAKCSSPAQAATIFEKAVVDLLTTRDRVMFVEKDANGRTVANGHYNQKGERVLAPHDPEFYAGSDEGPRRDPFKTLQASKHFSLACAKLHDAAHEYGSFDPARAAFLHGLADSLAGHGGYDGPAANDSVTGERYRAGYVAGHALYGNTHEWKRIKGRFEWMPVEE